jgi:ankyrin repeat protein
MTVEQIYGSLLGDITSEKIFESDSVQVVGPPGHGKSALLKFIAQRILQETPVIIIENILKPEVSSLYDVHLSFVHQIISQQPSLFYAVRNMMAEILSRRTWTLGSVWILLVALLQHSQTSAFLILIYDYNEWPDEICSWWLNSLLPVLLSSGSRFTFVTSSHSNIEDLSCSEPYRLDLQKKHAKYWSKFVRVRLDALLDRGYGAVKLGQDQIQGLKSKITTKAKAFEGSFVGVDNYLTGLLSSFSLTTLEAIEGHIEASPKTEQDFYQLEIAALRRKHIDVFFWISSVISWTMGAVRPLRIEELAAAAAVTLEDSDVREIFERVSMDMEGDLGRHLGFVVAIENGQARIASSSARTILATPLAKKQFDLQGDHELTLLCLHYLELIFKDIAIKNLSEEQVDKKDMAETKDMMETRTKPQEYKTLGTEALGFLDYACRFWPTHFLRIKSPHKKLRDAVIEFLSAPGIGDAWFRRYLRSHGESQLVRQFTEAKPPVRGSIGIESAHVIDGRNTPDSSLADTLDSSLADTLDSRSADTTKFLKVVRMACHVGLVAIIPDLLVSHKLTERPAMIDVRRGYSERSVAVLDFSYQLDCAISNDDASLVMELLDSQSSKSFPLHQAALGGSLAVAQMLCAQPENLVERDTEGRIPLHLAATGGSVELIFLLLANTPPDGSGVINTQDAHLKTPLITASYMGHVAATKLLVQCAADCKIADDTGRTALHYAVLTCSDAVQDLSFRELAHVPDNHGCTPLHLAAMSGSGEIVSTIAAALDDSGRFSALINQTDNNDKTPLQYAAEGGYKSIVEEFLRRRSDIVKDNHERAAELAAARGHLATVLLFVSSADEPIESQLLIEASKAGQLLVVQYFLGVKNTSPDAEYLGSRPLCHAAAEGHMKIARALLRRGASIDMADGKRKTPLHYAAENGRYAMAEMLLPSKANASPPDFERRTPLHGAAAAGKTDLVVLFLNRGANIEARSRTMETPLHSSISNPAVVKILLDHGADIKAADTLSQTPLHLAARFGSFESAQHLLGSANLDAVDDYGKPALYYAIGNDDLPMVKLLRKDRRDLASLKKEAEWAIDRAAALVFKYLLDLVLLPTRDWSHELGRLLHIAASRKSAEIVRFLLESRADVNFRRDDLTPLHLAVQSGSTKLIQVLLEKEANVHATDGDERTPLHHAATRNSTDAIEILLKAGANINAQDDEGRTPVWTTAFLGHIESLKKLFEWKPDLKLANVRGWSPLHAGADSLDITKLLLEAVKEPNPQDSSRWTPLHLCTYWRHEDVVKYLLENGADPKLVTDSNKTALHFAVDTHSPSIVSAMLEHGAAEFIDAPDASGETPFHLAVECQRCPIKMIQLLIDHGANLSKQSSDKTSNLVLAVKRGSLPVFTTLLHTPSKVPSEPTWQHEELVAAYWKAIELGITGGKKIADIVEVLLEKHPELIDAVTPEEGLTGLEMCLSKRELWRKEELVAIRLVKAGANPFSRSRPDRSSGLELGIISRQALKADFLKLCESIDVEGTAVADIGFKELRIATELEQADLWIKLDKLQPWKKFTDTDHDGWNLEHFIHQAAGRLPVKVKPPLPTSFKTPKKMVFPQLWAPPGKDVGSRFKIADDGLTVFFPGGLSLMIHHAIC